VTSQDVDDVDEPTRQRPELLVAQADAAVQHAALGLGELVREAARPFGGDARGSGDSRRAPLRDKVTQRVDSVDQLGDWSEVDQVVGEEHVDHREKQRRIRTRGDRQPLACPIGGAGATGIDHDDLAATFLNRVDLAHEVRACQ
jgi:hypothetical protein